MALITIDGKTFIQGSVSPTPTQDVYILKLYATEKAFEFHTTLRRKVEQLLRDYPLNVKEYKMKYPSTTAPLKLVCVQSNSTSDPTAQLAIEMAEFKQKYLDPVEQGMQELDEDRRKFVELRYFNKKSFNFACDMIPCSAMTAARWLKEKIIPTFGRYLEVENERDRC